MGGNRGLGVMDDQWDRIVKLGGSMASDAIPPLEVYSGTSKYNKGTQTWIAETEARAAHGGLIDRTIGALYLSAYLANSEIFFVGKGARIRFNLSPDQLRRGLDRLEDRGLIETAQGKRKGRYRRLRLR